MSGLLLTQDFPPALPGGISVYYYHLCRAIGGAVSVLAPRAADAAEFDASQPFAIHRCRMPTVPLAHRREIHLQALRWPRVAYVAASQWLAFYRRGLELVRGEPGQIALLGHLYLAPLGPWLRRRAGIRYGVFLHSGELYRYMSIRPVRSAMIAALDDADFLIVNSDFTRRQYLERGVRSDQRFLKVNPGVDTSRFRPDAGDPVGVRRRFGLGDRPVVLSVARLVEQKGHDNVLGAFAQILTRVPEATYVIAGDGPFRPDLERLARELGLEGRVVFAGFVPEAELPSYYRAADVVVVPSREFRKGVPIEGFGMVYVEAGACGTPAVGGRGGGTEESIEDGETGFRVDAEDPAAIGDAVARLLSDRELASRFGAAGRRRALERFDWRIQAEVLRRFLDELPGGAAASRERVGGEGGGEVVSERLRVLQVTAIPITAVRFVEPLARALRENGCDVEFASGPGRGAEELERRGFSVHRFPISRNPLDWRNGRAIRRLRSLLERRRFDVVHTHTPAAAAVARIAALGSRAASFYTMHGSFWGAGVSAGRRTLYTLLERALARRTDTIFTVNPEDAADCVDRARVGRDHVVTLPAGGAGVDPDFFVDRASADGWRREAREELGVPPDASVVAYVGRTAAAKGMGLLARAFARLCRQLPHVKLLVVGGPLPGDREPYSEARFRREVGEAASRHVVWTGFTDRVAPLIAAADAVVLPSRREGFGMSLAEAAAIGRAVVATDTRGARAVVEDGVTGLLVPVDDHLALAEGLLALLRDPERRSRMGELARRRAGDRFTRAGVLAVYLERYRGLQNGAGA